ncbi:MAG: DUF3127 domain-containing protein [Cyclonatronaceae bacterium]
MSLEISGTLHQILPKQTGESKRGPWEKQDFVIETQDKFPKKVCCTLWGDKTNMLQNLSTGTPLNVSINIESREYRGKWYTDVKAWKLEVGGENGGSNRAEGSGSNGMVGDVPPPDDSDLPADDDALPF